VVEAGSPLGAASTVGLAAIAAAHALGAARDRPHPEPTGGPSGSRHTAAWYRRADVLVVPSRYEPFGMVILEGMLHGLPIVASAVGGPAEILDDEHTELLFPPMDVGRLSRQLIRLVHNADLRQQLGMAATAELRFRWLRPQTVEAMRHVYEEVIPPAASSLALRAS
jgi:glycosyltransferase involved in cell wall biosynthesis